MNRKILVDLRNILATLYSNEADIRRIGNDSGIDLRHINFNTSAINIWNAVLTEAEKHQQVEELLKAVEGEYPRSQPFHDAYSAYRQLASATGLTDLVSSSPDNDQKSQHKLGRQWLFALFSGLVVIGFIAMRSLGIIGPRDDSNDTPTAVITTLNTSTLALTGTVTAETTPIITNTQSALPGAAVQPTPVFTETVTEMLVHTPTVTFTPTLSPTAISDTSTSQPTATMTPPPTEPQLAATVIEKTFPCQAQVIASSGTVKLGSIYTVPNIKSPKRSSVEVGIIVTVTQPSPDGLWYHIVAETSGELGWISSPNLSLLSDCPN